MTIKFNHLLAVLLFGFSFTAYADVYEYIDEEGTTHLSDAPVSDQYVLILKSEVPLRTDATISTELSSEVSS